MSATTDAFWRRVQRRATALTPELSRAYLRAIETLKGRLRTQQVEQWIAAGAVEAVIHSALSEANLDAAFAPFRGAMQMVTRDAVAYFGRDIPGVKRAGVTVLFDTLNPNVITAVRALDTSMMRDLKDSVRETVRAAIEQGLKDGVGPRTTARGLRDVLGLSPTQRDAVQRYEAALRGGPRESVLQGALDKLLRDRRFDKTVAAAKEGGYSLTEKQITTMTDAYRRRMVAFNAETNARTATLDALKLGQRLSWDDARAKGVLDGLTMMRTYKGVLDDRERPEHLALEGETVPADQPYSSGQMYAGEGDWNCRCIDIYHAARN